jgi:hypothetical protein
MRSTWSLSAQGACVPRRVDHRLSSHRTFSPFFLLVCDVHDVCVCVCVCVCAMYAMSCARASVA